jgi:hypothetical protein
MDCHLLEFLLLAEMPGRIDRFDDEVGMLQQP